MKKRFSEEQNVRILKEADSAGTAREVVRKHNISEQTFYRWKQKYGGMDVPDALRELGHAYIEHTRVQRKLGTPFFIDKMPNNFTHVGLIH